jgi:hypothetical protein
MAVPIRTPEPAAYLDGRTVVITALSVEDPDVVDLVERADDPVRAVSEALALGARVMRTTQTTVDAAVVEQRFAAFEERVDAAFTKAVEQIEQTATAYLDPEDGALKVVVDEFERNLDHAFDPESKASVIGKFDERFVAGTSEMKRVVRDTVDPGNPESPLGRLRTDLFGEMREIRRDLSDLRTTLAVEQAQADVLDLTAVKGRRYEEVVFGRLSELACPSGDLVDYTADTTGPSGKAGDVVVTLNPDETRGAELSFVVEVNDEKLGMRAALAKLDKAMKNRNSKAGVIVFPSQEKAPTAVPFAHFDHTAFVICDKDGADTQALRFGLIWARWVLLRENGELSDQFDAERAACLIDQGVRALKRVTTIKGGLTRAGNELDGVRGHVTELSSEIEQTLEALAQLIRKP